MQKIDQVRWEDRPENKSAAKQIIEAYGDHTIPVGLIADQYGVSDCTVRAIVKRAGLSVRQPKKHSNKSTVTTLETLSQEEADLRAKLKEVEQKKADLTVRVESAFGVVTIFGLAEAPVVTNPGLARRWLEGGGPGKLRDAVGRKP